MSARDASIRFQQALEMADLGFAMMRENLKRRFPNATKAELNDKFSDWLMSRPPMSGRDLRVVTGKRAMQRFLKPASRKPTSVSKRQTKRAS